MFTFVITIWTFSLVFNVIGSEWTVTTRGVFSVSSTDFTMSGISGTFNTSVVTDGTVFFISFIETNWTFTSI